MTVSGSPIRKAMETDEARYVEEFKKSAIHAERMGIALALIDEPTDSDRCLHLEAENDVLRLQGILLKYELKKSEDQKTFYQKAFEKLLDTNRGLRTMIEKRSPKD